MKWRNLSWIGSLYFSQGMPYALISMVAAILYKNFHVSNVQNAFFTSLLLLPWSFKPLWAPLLEMQFTKKQWLVRFQVIEAIFLVVITIALATQHFFYISLIAFFLLACCAASFDIVCDGYYMVYLPFSEQSLYVGTRTLFYQCARLFMQGLLLIGVGYSAFHLGVIKSWQSSFLFLAITFAVLSLLNQRLLVEVEQSQELPKFSNMLAVLKTFKAVCVSFISMPYFALVIIFLFTYNAVEAQLLKIVPLFMLDRVSHGGLALGTANVGIIYGTLGTAAMMLGALLGGIAVSRFGLKKMLIIFSVLMMASNYNYYWLSQSLTQNKFTITLLVVIAQFCYGLANSAYMSFLLKAIANLQYRTSCYALGTAIMCLSYIVFGSFSGLLQHYLLYPRFFLLLFGVGIFILVFTLLVVKQVRYDAATISVLTD